MFARDHLGFIIALNTTAVVCLAFILLVFIGPGPWLLIVLVQWSLPWLLRAIWPILERYPYSTPGRLILAAITFAAGVGGLFYVFARGGNPWLLLLTFLCLAEAAWVLHHDYRGYLRQKRMIDHVCPKCEYDLRASLGRCPECGTPIPDEYRYYLTRDPASIRPPEKTLTLNLKKDKPA